MSEKSPSAGRKFNGVWLALGVAIGTAVGVAIKNLAIGVGVGAVIGVGLAFALRGKR